MRNIIFFLFGIIFLLGSIYPANITIDLPKGGESLEKNSETSILWYAEGINNGFKITLWQNDILIGVINSNVANGNGNLRYNWKVGEYIGGNASSGNGYKIKIKEKGTSIADMSDSPFSIRDKVILRVVNPRRGKKWQKGRSHKVEWIGVGKMANSVKIFLVRANGHVEKIFASEAPNNNDGGTFEGNYIVIANMLNGVRAGTYKIRVQTTDHQIYDDSQSFEIIDIPPIRGEGGRVNE